MDLALVAAMRLLLLIADTKNPPKFDFFDSLGYFLPSAGPSDYDRFWSNNGRNWLENGHPSPNIR
jgi:hypothetical protein